MNRYFRKIEEFPDYFISNNGSIFSKKSNKNLKHNNRHITLHKDGKKYVRSISKIIKNTFQSSEKIDNTNFVPILGFENYLIDKFGNIRSTKINGYKKGFINPYGYLCVFLSKEGKVYNKLVHRLVYEAWKGKIPIDITIDHIDEDKKNNFLDNLQILSRSENVLKFHSERGRNRNIEGFVKIDNFDNYYINKDGEVISFKYGEKSHKISYKNGYVALRKDNKRHHLNINYLLNKYFGKDFIKQKKMYKNID